MTTSPFSTGVKNKTHLTSVLSRKTHVEIVSRDLTNINIAEEVRLLDEISHLLCISTGELTTEPAPGLNLSVFLFLWNLYGGILFNLSNLENNNYFLINWYPLHNNNNNYFLINLHPLQSTFYVIINLIIIILK